MSSLFLAQAGSLEIMSRLSLASPWPFPPRLSGLPAGQNLPQAWWRSMTCPSWLSGCPRHSQCAQPSFSRRGVSLPAPSRPQCLCWPPERHHLPPPIPFLGPGQGSGSGLLWRSPSYFWEISSKLIFQLLNLTDIYPFKIPSDYTNHTQQLEFEYLLKSNIIFFKMLYYYMFFKLII